MNEKSLSLLKDALREIDDFDRLCESDEETDTEIAWNVFNSIRRKINKAIEPTA